MEDIAHLARAEDCGSSGSGFDSHYSPTAALFHTAGAELSGNVDVRGETGD